MQKKEAAEKRLAKLRDDHVRSAVRHVDFPSVSVTFQEQTKKATSDVAMCNDSIKKVDEQLQSQFGQLSTNQVLSNLAGQKHSQLDPAKGEPTKSQPPDREKSPKQPATFASESLTLHLDQKINEFKRKFDSDLQDLKDQVEATRQEKEGLELENTNLKKSQDEMTREIQQLQDKFKILEQKSVAGLATASIQLTAMNEQVNKKFADLNTKYQPKSQPQPDLKLPPKAEPGVSEAQFNDVVRSQNAKIATFSIKINSALSSITKYDEQFSGQFGELRKSSRQMDKKIPDISQLNTSVSDHARRISDQKTMLDKMVAHLSSLQSLVSEIPLDKLKPLLDDVPAIQKRLKEDDARTADFMTKDRVYDMLKSELAGPAEMLLNDTTKSHSNAMTEDKVREILKQELAVTAIRLQEMFSTRLDVMANHFGGFIDKERAARGKADEKLSALSDRVSSLQKEADGVNSPTDSASSFRRACEVANVAQAKRNQHMSAQIYQHSQEVEGHRNTLSTLTTQMEELRDELRKGYEGHQMQIMHLSSSVFNTRRMYNDIVAHINATTPTGHNLSIQIRALSGRLDALENKEGREDEGGVKKRKAPNGNAVLIHNGR
ncbi:hypothetical protein EDB81DRAFT_893996 [Dactylonectria macrodidyma]|uniref:Uncharacterized protein n=1 Tax=Dactylonectria macrodidyma TaxID=307937 RepID=A0A9P9D4C5_9HYPO|nr:hypothetical protein EDB81DRAFT_893996 [Dactylonectria macrodidyma]